MPSDLTKTREMVTRVRPVRVRLACAVVGCAGYMECTGSGFTQIHTTWDHRCSMCGILEGIEDARYPRIEYVEA